MAQSLSQVYLHIVFSTKNRSPFLQDKPLRTRLYAYLSGTCRNLSSPSMAIGGVEDHVHVFCRQAKTISVADLIRELKRESSKWIKQQETKLMSFHWQNGYGAFSISPSHIDPLVQYIASQEEHHKKESFQDELRRLCGKYDLELDERYCWE